LAQAVDLTPYRPGQGIYARAATGVALLLVALFGSVRLFQLTRVEKIAFKVLGMGVPEAALWAGGVFIVLGAVIFLITFGPQTGLRGLDSKTKRLIDLLIDTEAELAKVSWPSSQELTSSTTAVLVSIILLGAFLFCVDWLAASLMRSLQVLPS